MVLRPRRTIKRQVISTSALRVGFHTLESLSSLAPPTTFHACYLYLNPSELHSYGTLCSRCDS